MDKHGIMQLAQETLIGYVFWSLVHGLGPMIWFYPLNELDITGYEAFVVVAFSPILFACGPRMRKVISCFNNIPLLIGMIVGCASFNSPSTLSRLIALSVGVGAAFLMQGSTWWTDDDSDRKLIFWGHTLGYFALLSSRIWYISVTPLWSDVTSNKTIVTMLAIVVGIKMFQSKKEVKNEKEKAKEVSNISFLGELMISLGYGATFFMIHAVFGEVSILTRFTVSGFPSTGPMPNPWSGLVLVMLTLGTILTMMTDISHSRLWSIVGFVSSVGLIFLNTWAAFASGCVLALYIASVWPNVCENLINTKNPGKSLIIGNSVYLLGVFGMVWCTAYNFVPFGGELARERTYIIIGLMMILIGLSATTSYPIKRELTIFLNPPEKRFYVKPGPGDSPRGKPSDQKFSLVQKFLFAFAILGLIGFKYRDLVLPRYNNVLDFQNENIKNKEFSAAIWTFHFGYDNQGWPSFERAADLLNKTGADVITLLESDASKPYLGNNDIALWLGERLGMHVDFGPSTRDHTWGNLLLSKYPIVKSQHHLLPSPHGELAPAISATINISNNLVDFVVTHMGNDRDNLDRKLQAETLAGLCNKAENPVVFLGYVTSSPGSRDYKKLVNDGRMKDIDSTDQDRWCEYIMYRGLTRLGYARISHGGLSDTEVQMARWRIPTDKAQRDNDKMTTDETKVDASLHFNKVFGSIHPSHWYGRSHNYHMGTPKYFIP